MYLQGEESARHQAYPRVHGVEVDGCWAVVVGVDGGEHAAADAGDRPQEQHGVHHLGVHLAAARERPVHQHGCDRQTKGTVRLLLNIII